MEGGVILMVVVLRGVGIVVGGTGTVLWWLGGVVEIELELHFVCVEGRGWGLVLRLAALGVERDLDLGWGIWVDDADVNLLKVFEKGMEVMEMDTAARVVPTELAFTVKDVEGVHNVELGAFWVIERGKELCRGGALREACAERACAPGDGRSEEVACV